jgi:hypothetical protein
MRGCAGRDPICRIHDSSTDVVVACTFASAGGEPQWGGRRRSWLQRFAETNGDGHPLTGRDTGSSTNVRPNATPDHSSAADARSRHNAGTDPNAGTAATSHRRPGRDDVGVREFRQAHAPVRGYGRRHAR